MTPQPESPPKRAVRLSSPTQRVLAGAALLLPTLTLVPLGGLYLWEHGLLLWWALGALLVGGAITAGLHHALSRPARGPEILPDDAQAQGDAHWTKAEAEAWKDVLAIAARVEVDKMTSADYFVELGQRTLDSVAKRLHGEKSDALWRFTLPEALAIVERVSRRLGKFVVASVPFGDRLTVAQVLAAYRWRGVVDVAERAYDIWRILRIVNPATAVTNEARERLSRAVYHYGKEHVSRRIAEAFVEEVGRAAIDLYGGRLKVAERLKEAGAPALDDDMLRQLKTQRIALRLVVGGASRSDRLAVASLLSDVLDQKRISQAAAPDMAITVIGAPAALRSQATETAAAVKELDGADIIVWLASAEALEPDVAVLRTLKLALEASSSGEEIPPLVVPVFIEGAGGERVGDRAQISHALSAATGGPSISGVAVSQIDISPPDALGPVADVVADRLEQARRVNMIRKISDAKRSGSWRDTARQAWRAAGSLTRVVTSRKRS